MCEDNSDLPCSESKQLALLTALTCLVKTLAETEQLDTEKFSIELTQGRAWLDRFDHPPGHQVKAFDDVAEMLLKSIQHKGK